MKKSMIKAHFDSDFNDDDLLKRFGLEPGGRAQQVLDAAVIRYNLPYVPWETGTLARSPYAVTEIGTGEVVYPGPYAHYQYYGESVLGNPLNYNTDLNPLAGSFWFERMKADHLQDIMDEVKQAVKG